MKILRRLAGRGRLIAFLMLVGFVWLRLADPFPVEFARLKVFDFYQQFKPREVSQRPVVIVDIDEKSLGEIGQWPWPRNILADLVIRLGELGVVVVGFDMVFPEPDRYSPSVYADDLGEDGREAAAILRTLRDNDQRFADAMKAVPVVLGITESTLPTDKDRDPLKTSFASRRVFPSERLKQAMGIASDPKVIRDARTFYRPHELVSPFIRHLYGVTRNLPVLEENAAGMGMFSLGRNQDQTIRTVPTLSLLEDTRILPALSVELLRVALRRPTLMVDVYDATPDQDPPSEGIEAVQIAKNFGLVTQSDGRVWPYFSRHDREKYVSAADILNGKTPAAAVQGRIAIVGTSAPGLLDIRTIPTEAAIPGVEIHAQTIEAVIEKSLLLRPWELETGEVFFGAVAGLLMILLVPLVGARWTLLVMFILVGGAFYFSWFLFTEHLLLLDASYAAGTIFLIYTYMAYAGFAGEEAKRRQVRDAFAFYLAPAMVDRLAENPDSLKLGGDKRDMTFLFCDVRGFTAISERYDPETLTLVLNRLLTPLTEAVLSQHGTVDKYMGDCIMAFWNAPMDDAHHAENACMAALEMNRRMIKFNTEMRAEITEKGLDYADLAIGIGINSGEAIVGNMGSTQRFDYSVLGDNVNLASRLEGQCKTYKVDRVLGSETARLVDGMALIELDLLQVKGREAPERVYFLAGDQNMGESAVFAAYREAHGRLLAAYRDQAWAAAQSALDLCVPQAAELGLDGYCSVMAKRIADFKITPPPPGWKGVHVAEGK
ncbi:MAG: CHASE2 domain-containing protein [Magnetospiraceae bacterium]